MKNFFEKAKIAVGAAVMIAGSQEAGAAELTVKDSNIDKTGIAVQNGSEEQVNEKTFVFGGKEINEKNEKIINLEIAKEALMNAGKGAYVSKQMPGFVMISENTEPDHGGSFYNHSLQVKAYKVTNELVNGYYIMNISINAEENGKEDDALQELNKNGVDSDFKVNSRLNPTNPLGLTYVYSQLREKLDPTQTQILLEKTNPEITKENLIASLKGQSDYGTGDREEILKDIETLRQSPQEDNKLASALN